MIVPTPFSGSTGDIFTRHPANPLLTSDQWPSTVNVVFNPAAAMLGETTVLLARVEDRSGLSHLHVARSANGFTDWSIDPVPALSPVANDQHAAWGFEDPRMVWVPELGRFAITCTAYGPVGPSVHLALTDDFVQYEHLGIIMQPEDKNAALFPRRIGGNWVLLHRPVVGPQRRSDVWLSRSADLIGWRAPEPVLSCRPSAWWDGLRIGIGPPPIETEHGWLVLYHGVKQTVAGAIYRVGAVLLDLDEPTIVLRRTPSWLLSPTAPYERVGDVGNVVFPCGAVVVGDGELRLYYGAADTSVCAATASLADLLSLLLDDRCAIRN